MCWNSIDLLVLPHANSVKKSQIYACAGSLYTFRSVSCPRGVETVQSDNPASSLETLQFVTCENSLETFRSFTCEIVQRPLWSVSHAGLFIEIAV